MVSKTIQFYTVLCFFIAMLLLTVEAAGKDKKHNQNRGRKPVLDDMHTVIVDLESEVPFGDPLSESSDGLHSVKFDPPILNFSEKPVCMQWANRFTIRNNHRSMDLRIVKVEFSSELLMSLSPNYPLVIASDSYENFELRFIPDVIGEIKGKCTFFTNMGILEYHVTIVGIKNDYGVESLLDLKIPRGSVYTHTVQLYNPSRDKKIRIHRVGANDSSVLEVIINTPTELDWYVNEQEKSDVFLFQFRRSDRSSFYDYVFAVTSVGTFYIPVAIQLTTSSLVTKPESFNMDPLPMTDHHVIKDLEVLNSYEENVGIVEVRAFSTSPLDERPVLDIKNSTLPSFQYVIALQCSFYCMKEGVYEGIILVKTNVTKSGLNQISIPYKYQVVNGSIQTPSPLYFCLKPSMRSKLVTIPVKLHNGFNIPVVITHIGISTAVTSLLSVTTYQNETRFTMTPSIQCFANPNEDFSPLYFVFHANRYRPRIARSLFTSTVHITTTITSFDIDLIIHDGQLSAYVSNTVLSSPDIDGNSINWGAKMQPVTSLSSNYYQIQLDMGYLHQQEHCYQTLILYNRNPVEITTTVFSSKVPNVLFYPIYRAQLVNQTSSYEGHPSFFTLPAHELHFAPWEYMVFVIDVTPVAKQPKGIDTYYNSMESIPSIITYNYSSVVVIDNELQHMSLDIHYMFLNGSLSIGTNNTIDLKVYFGRDSVHYNLNYVNTLGADLQISGVEVTSKSMLLHYPKNALTTTSEKQPVFLGTLTYDPSEEFDTCRTLLCHVLPVKNGNGMEMSELPTTVSHSMLENRLKSKEYYREISTNYQSETLSVKTDLAGVLNVNINIHPVVLNLFYDPRHQVTNLLSKGLYSLLDSVGVFVDWFNIRQSSLPQHYRYVPSVQVDQDLFFHYYTKNQLSYSYRVNDLCDIKALSIANGQHLTINNQDFHIFTDTVVNTSHSSTIPLYNSLDIPILVRVADYSTQDLPSDYLSTNCSEAFSFAESAILEAVIPPNGRVELGPVVFTPTELGVCTTYLIIVNNYTGLESLFLVGRSVQQPLLLTDNQGIVDEIIHLSYQYSATTEQSRNNEINHAITTFYRMELLLSREYTIRIYNVSLLTDQYTHSPRAHVVVRLVEASHPTSGSHRKTDDEHRLINIPLGGITNTIPPSYGSIPPSGLLFHTGLHLQILLSNYPSCSPDETLKLVVNSSIGISEYSIHYTYSPLIERICVRNFSLATSAYLYDMRYVILLLLVVVTMFLVFLYNGIHFSYANTIDGRFFELLRPDLTTKTMYKMYGSYGLQAVDLPPSMLTPPSIQDLTNGSAVFNLQPRKVPRHPGPIRCIPSFSSSNNLLAGKEEKTVDVLNTVIEKNKKSNELTDQANMARLEELQQKYKKEKSGKMSRSSSKMEMKEKENKSKMKSEVKHKEVKHEEVKPEVKHKEVKHEEVKPEEKHKEVKHEEVKPEEKHEEVKHEVKHEEVKPEVKPEEVKAEETEEVKPVVKSEEKPSFIPEENEPKEVKPEKKLKDEKPKEVKSEVKTEETQTEDKPINPVESVPSTNSSVASTPKSLSVKQNEPSKEKTKKSIADSQTTHSIKPLKDIKHSKENSNHDLQSMSPLVVTPSVMAVLESSQVPSMPLPTTSMKEGKHLFNTQKASIETTNSGIFQFNKSVPIEKKSKSRSATPAKPKSSKQDTKSKSRSVTPGKYKPNKQETQMKSRSATPSQAKAKSLQSVASTSSQLSQNAAPFMKDPLMEPSQALAGDDPVMNRSIFNNQMNYHTGYSSLQNGMNSPFGNSWDYSRDSQYYPDYDYPPYSHSIRPSVNWDYPDLRGMDYPPFNDYDTFSNYSNYPSSMFINNSLYPEPRFGASSRYPQWNDDYGMNMNQDAYLMSGDLDRIPDDYQDYPVGIHDPDSIVIPSRSNSTLRSSSRLSDGLSPSFGAGYRNSNSVNQLGGMNSLSPMANMSSVRPGGVSAERSQSRGHFSNGMDYTTNMNRDNYSMMDFENEDPMNDYSDLFRY